MQFSRAFTALCGSSADSDGVTVDSLVAFCTKFNVIPALTSADAVALLFDIVNASEASDGAATLDPEEFNETIARLGVLCGPVKGDLTKDAKIAESVRGLLAHMNASGAGTTFSPTLEFNVSAK
jgi:hypothetical protein